MHSESIDSASASEVRFARPVAFRFERKSKLYSQRSLAASTGISQPVLCRIESGRRPASADEALAIAFALGVRVSEIFETFS